MKNTGPTSTVEDYLKCILLRSTAENERVGMGEIAAALSVAPGTVTAMMKALADSGLVEYEPYNGVVLSGAGRRLATHVLRRHRLIEKFLVEVMDLDWSEVHAEAELLEHAVSDRLIERMDDMLGRPSVDPHGDPIPDAHGVVDERSARPLAGEPSGAQVVVRRVADQSREFLRFVDQHGLQPGARLRVTARDEMADSLHLEVGGEKTPVALGLRAASKIFVE